MSFNRKLEIGHWNQGKGCKGSRKAKVRAFTEAEIEAQIAEQDENYRTRHISKGKPNHIARLEHQIQWYEKTIAEHERRERGTGRWADSFTNYCRDALAKAKKKLEELKNAVRS